MIDTVGGDTVIGLYDAVGNLVQWNDDIGRGNYWSRLAFGDGDGDLPAGEYYLATSWYPTSPYPPGPGFDFVSASDASGWIGADLFYGTDVGTLPQGTVQTEPQALNDGDPGEVQWYRFELTDDIYAEEGDRLVINTDLSSVGDTEIGLYDANGIYIIDDDDSGELYHSELRFGDGSAYPWIGLPAGIYYLAAGSFNMAFGSSFYDVTGGAIPGDIVLSFDATFADGLPGDYNDDGVVDAADYIVWRKTYSGPNIPPTSYAADGDGDGDVDGDDYAIWTANFGQTAGSGAVLAANSTARAKAGIPEPATLWLLVIAGGLVHLRHRVPRRAIPQPLSTFRRRPFLVC
jgi:hypothetical protein